MKNRISYASRLIVFDLKHMVLAALLLLPGLLCAEVSYTLVLEGIPQSSVSSLQFAQGITNTPAGTLIHNDLRVVKPVDVASPLLLKYLCATQEIPSVTFLSLETKPESTHYYKITLKNVLVSSYSAGTASSNDPPTEEITLNYTEIEWTYIVTDPVGTGQGASSANWDRLTSTGEILDPDSDGDGILDSYEVQEQLKPLIDDADEDDDDDGMSNKDEFDAGTLAGDRKSIFKVTGLITPVAGGVLYTVTFNSVPGRSYTLLAAESLETAFQPVGNVTATDPVTSIDLTLPQFRAFVKVIVLPL